MPRFAREAFVGALGFDTIARISGPVALALANQGMKFAVRYLGSVSSPEIDNLLAAGICVMPVTYGMKHGTPLNAAFGRRYGDGSVANAQSAGFPKGVTLWLDLEDCTGTDEEIEEFVNAWCEPVLAAGFMPGLYVGYGAQLDSKKLYALKVVRYWQSLSKETDRAGSLAEPMCGWCMIQLYPSIVVANTLVDVDVIQKDYRNRLPVWCAPK